MAFGWQAHGGRCFAYWVYIVLGNQIKQKNQQLLHSRLRFTQE